MIADGSQKFIIGVSVVSNSIISISRVHHGHLGPVPYKEVHRHPLPARHPHLQLPDDVHHASYRHVALQILLPRPHPGGAEPQQRGKRFGAGQPQLRPQHRVLRQPEDSEDCGLQAGQLSDPQRRVPGPQD